MKKLIYLLSVALLVMGCATQGDLNRNTRNVTEKVVAVKVEGNTTVVSSGKNDKWFRVNARLNEGMVYEVRMEIPRVITETVFIPANLLNFDVLEFLQRDIYLTYITKYQELQTVEKSTIATN